MNPRRYRYEKVPISKKEAQKWRKEEIAFLRSQIKDLEDEILGQKSMPLPTEREIQIEVSPGDPGYDEAPFELSYVQYQGAFQFIETAP